MPVLWPVLLWYVVVEVAILRRVPKAILLLASDGEFPNSSIA